MELDLVTATVNDCGTMLDLLEQMEAEFRPALRQLGESAESQVQRMESRAQFLGEEVDEFDRENQEQAQEDLNAIAQDIPRARDEVLKCGTHLVGILVDIVAADIEVRSCS